MAATCSGRPVLSPMLSVQCSASYGPCMLQHLPEGRIFSLYIPLKMASTSSSSAGKESWSQAFCPPLYPLQVRVMAHHHHSVRRSLHIDLAGNPPSHPWLFPGQPWYSRRPPELPWWLSLSGPVRTSQGGAVIHHVEYRNRLAPASAPVMVSIHFLLICIWREEKNPRACDYFSSQTGNTPRSGRRNPPQIPGGFLLTAPISSLPHRSQHSHGGITVHNRLTTTADTTTITSAEPAKTGSARFRAVPAPPPQAICL